MAMSTKERVETLENALKELAYAGRHTDMAIAELKESGARLHQELRELSERTDQKLERIAERARQEIEQSAELIRQELEQREERRRQELEQREEENRLRLQQLTDSTLQYIRESADRTDAMVAEVWARIERTNAASNKRWGELANKMGSFVEDVVQPNFPHILERYFGVTELDDMLILRYKPHPTDKSKRKEFDLVAWTDDTVFWSETKSTATVERFREFARDTESVFEYFPEVTGKRLVKIGSALAIPSRVVAYLTKHGCYAMMLGDETMDIANFEAVHPA